MGHKLQQTLCIVRDVYLNDYFSFILYQRCSGLHSAPYGSPEKNFTILSLPFFSLF